MSIPSSLVSRRERVVVALVAPPRPDPVVESARLLDALDEDETSAQRRREFDVHPSHADRLGLVETVDARDELIQSAFFATLVEFLLVESLLDAFHLRGEERLRDELLAIVAPRQHLADLSAQTLADVAQADVLLADARRHRIRAVLLRASAASHRNLGQFAAHASDGFDDDVAVRHFGNFRLEHLGEESRDGGGDDDGRAFIRRPRLLLHLNDDGARAIALRVSFPGNGFLLGQARERAVVELEEPLALATLSDDGRLHHLADASAVALGRGDAHRLGEFLREHPGEFAKLMSLPVRLQKRLGVVNLPLHGPAATHALREHGERARRHVDVHARLARPRVHLGEFGPTHIAVRALDGARHSLEMHPRVRLETLALERQLSKRRHHGAALLQRETLLARARLGRRFDLLRRRLGGRVGAASRSSQSSSPHPEPPPSSNPPPSRPISRAAYELSAAGPWSPRASDEREYPPSSNPSAE